ncbi:MAG: hypothetical protein IBX62_03400 [Coriobacteriia bacterium]|nr:hypothetical protein [Coriobacteriia bacterium]
MRFQRIAVGVASAAFALSVGYAHTGLSARSPSADEVLPMPAAVLPEAAAASSPGRAEAERPSEEPDTRALRRPARRVVSEREARAQRLLDRYIERYPILEGVTVEYGPTPGGAQAVAFYRQGRIVVDPGHVASIERIMAHEIWHVIDWRDNGRIDWGENVPPRAR